MKYEEGRKITNDILEQFDPSDPDMTTGLLFVIATQLMRIATALEKEKKS